MTPDVNILVAASRTDHPHHAVAEKWLRVTIETGTLVLLPMVAVSFIRLVTNYRIFPNPTPPNTALAFINAILEISESKLVPLSDEWQNFCKLVNEPALSANAIPDAWIAATVANIGEHLVTFDKGFRKLLARSQVTILKPT